MPVEQRFRHTIPEQLAGRRLDQALAELLPEYSRARLQQWLRSGCILIDGKILRPRDKVAGGEQVIGCIEAEEQTAALAQAIPLTICHEDEDILVIDKPAGLVVHPAAGNPDGTLVNALLHHAPELATLPRAGIVHRLDKDTSGLLVVARSLRAHTSLVTQLQARSMGREYLALVNGVLVAGGTVDAPIARHPLDRKRMAVVNGGKPAVTHYRVLQRYRAHSLLRLELETGRTHQIRVHMAHIRYPLIGDPVYGGRLRLPPAVTPGLQQQLSQFRRQALHATRLTLQHPADGETRSWESPPPADIERLIQTLAADQETADEHD